MCFNIDHNVVLTESIGPRVIYCRCLFQNERISTIVITSIPTKPGTYRLQFVRDVRQKDNTILWIMSKNDLSI